MRNERMPLGQILGALKYDLEAQGFDPDVIAAILVESAIAEIKEAGMVAITEEGYHAATRPSSAE